MRARVCSHDDAVPSRQVTELVFMQKEFKERNSRRRKRKTRKRKKEEVQQYHLPAIAPPQVNTTNETVLPSGNALYSHGRHDRSGSVITDMLYAHAYAFARGVQYGGACYAPPEVPKRPVRELLQSLGWNEFLPFACPAAAADSSIVDASVYRSSDHAYFTKEWRNHIQASLVKTTAAATKSKPSSPHVKEIAVHVRRGDVTPCRYKRRYLTNDHYLHLIELYSTPRDAELQLPNNVHVTIYSESESFESFDVFRDRGYDVELDTDLTKVWSSLATADVAILSRSFFSFVPAAINPNTVVYTSFFDFDPLDGWEVASKELEKQTDKEIRRMYKEQCDAAAIQAERDLQTRKHVSHEKKSVTK